MLKLYGGARSRASIVQWYLEEIGAEYEFILLNMEEGEHRQPEFLALNPMGKVPILVDGDFKLWESGAILLYLATKFGKMPNSLAESSIINQWVLFGNSTLATGLFIEANRDKEMPKLLTPLSEMLQSQPFILGEEFTAADVAVGSILAYVPMMLKLDLSAYPGVVNYIKRINERPAFGKTIGQRNAK